MSEWFKEHDWKSCDGGDSSGGSNPLLCASKGPPCAGFFVALRGDKKSGILRRSREAARRFLPPLSSATPSAANAFKAQPQNILFSAPYGNNTNSRTEFVLFFARKFFEM